MMIEALLHELERACARSFDFSWALDQLDLDAAHEHAPGAFARGYVEGVRAGAVAEHIPPELRDVDTPDPRRRGFAFGVSVAWMYA